MELQDQSQLARHRYLHGATSVETILSMSKIAALLRAGCGMYWTAPVRGLHIAFNVSADWHDCVLRAIFAVDLAQCVRANRARQSRLAYKKCVPDEKSRAISHPAWSRQPWV
jgi:hypothetical protein